MKNRVISLILLYLFLIGGCTSKFTNDNIISNKSLSFDNNITYTLKIIQTKYMTPPTPEDKNFDIYKSKYYGKFALITIDKKGKEIDRKDLNQFFGDVDIGFIGNFDMSIDDYNKDGDPDFVIGEPAENGNGMFRFALFSIKKDGTLYNLPADGYKEKGYVYCQSETHTTSFSLNDQGNGIKVIVEKLEGGGYMDGQYIWNGEKFTFKK